MHTRCTWISKVWSPGCSLGLSVPSPKDSFPFFFFPPTQWMLTNRAISSLKRLRILFHRRDRGEESKQSFCPSWKLCRSSSPLSAPQQILPRALPNLSQEYLVRFVDRLEEGTLTLQHSISYSRRTLTSVQFCLKVNVNSVYSFCP